MSAGPDAPESPFDELGGEPVLRAIVRTFVDRLFADPMIGFFFRSVDRDRLEQREYEHAAEHLGGPVRYAGRPLRAAHAPHRIMGGQFERRLAILKTTLEECGAPARVREHWLAHSESLRAEITSDPSGECVGSGAAR